MKRIRSNNINTQEHFNDVFKEDLFRYNSYENIKFYNKTLFNKSMFSYNTYLDYGCGGASGMNSVKDVHPSTRFIGVDISSFVVRENKKRFPQCDFYEVEELLNSDSKFDVVLSSHTFEHIQNPLEIASLLLKKTNKIMIIIVPYADSWNECGEHLWEYDKHSFDSLAPTSVYIGLTNKAGNTEIIYVWDKRGKKKKKSKLLFNIKKIPKQSFLGLLRRLFRLIRRIVYV